ncbi:hypothetical protein [Streptomyces sp. NRRL S-920]|uniref:hypothetical protein n=1 Tax=Streptomyces sp. NRRL S-920 TaxID=1463921 RepID=UPI0006901EA4|nr:hypothetical protein [Streptomyces sp. NRRL S-920]
MKTTDANAILSHLCEWASQREGNADRTREAGTADACTCVINCAEGPGGCSLSGRRHVHPRTRTGQYGPCPEHSDAPGDL